MLPEVLKTANHIRIWDVRNRAKMNSVNVARSWAAWPLQDMHFDRLTDVHESIIEQSTAE
jgi:hypothetical protein